MMGKKLRALWFRLRGLVDRERMEKEFASELESHLEMHIEDGLRAGLSAEEARRQALIKLGGMEQTRISYRERRGLPFLETLGQDVNYGTRILRKNPGFSFIAILTLALGIGANTALFSIVNGVLLNPLPYPRPNELVAVHASKPNFDEGSISFPNFRDWQRDNHTLAGLAVARQTTFSLTGNGEAERVRGDFVSSDFFSILGVKPILGRLFSAGEDEIGRGPVALISAGFRARKFGSNAGVIGKTVTLDGRNFTIVGVLPSSFDLSLSNFRLAEIYVPIGQWQTTALRDRGAGLGLHGIARIKPGFTLAQAEADMSIVSDHLALSFPAEDHGLRAKLVPLRQSTVGSVQPLLLVLFGAVGFLLLIACANVANLLLARSNARAQEFAIRSALGAGRIRIISQLLTESTMLALGGGASGLLLASWGTQAALKLVPATLPRSSEVHLSAPVLCFTLLVSLAVGILFGLLPVWKISRQEPQKTLKDGGRGASGTRHRTQGLLVVLEMALALVLLAGAGLMIRSMIALSAVDPGFMPQNVLTFSLSAPPSMATASSDAVRAYYREAHARITQVPGIEGVSLSWGAFPMSGDDEQLFWLDNEPKPANANDMDWALNYKIEPDYLKTMRIPLLRGRFFSEADNEHAPLVVVIDDILARKFFGNDDPIGKQINLDGRSQKATVIGLVGHVMQYGFADDSAHPLQAEMYTPFMQLGDSEMSLKDGLGTDVVIRSRDNSSAVLSEIRRAMREMNQEQVIYGTETMKQIIAASLAAQRFSMILLGLFAGVALLLAAVGLYGVVSYLVSQRTQEIGVRMALGADRMDVLRWVLQQGGKLALIGAGVGLVSALMLTQVMAHSSMIYGVRPYDPWTLASVTAFLMVVALAACYIPARRAMHILPMQALRAE